MPASALLKFVQGATVGGDGRALVGVLTTSVALSNVNNTSVASWQIDLVYVDPTSSLSIATPYAFNDASSTPAAAFAPDVRRSYRWQLKVWSVPNRAGEPDDIDIRVFSVRELNGALIPPSQVWPPPLPDPRSGELNAKPNEMNFSGQLDGWHGTGSDGLLNELLAKQLPPTPGSPGDVLTVSGGRWVSVAPVTGGTGDVIGPGVSVANNLAVYADTTGKLLADGGVAISAFIRHNGSVAFTGNQSLGGFKLTNNANGVAAQDLVTVAQLNAAIAGLDPKGNVRAYTTTNIAALTGLGALTGSGVASFTDGQRVGLGGQSTASQNGVWVVHAGAWTRPLDFNTGMDVSGAYFTVEEGTFADRAFLVQNDEGSAVVGTNNLVLIDFGTSSIAAGNGLQKIGNVLSILHDGATLSSSGSGLKVTAAGITTTEIAAGAVNLTTQVTGLLPFANIADGAAASVLGRSANSTGVLAAIASSADGQVLRRAAGALTFGAVDLADTDAVTGLLPLANLVGGSTVGQVLRNTAGNVPAWGAVDLADTDAVTGLLPFANIASGSGLSVLGRSVNSVGVLASIVGTADQVLAVNTAGTALAFGQVQTGGIATSAVTLAKLANATASSVLGRSAATGGVYADIASSADGQVLRRGAAGVIAFGAVDLADTDAITGLLPFANIASGLATSVFGRSANSVGVQASIAATVDGQVLQRVAGALAFATLGVTALGGGSAVGQVLTNAVGNVPTWGALDLADVDAVTGLLPFANIADGAANSVFGRAAATPGVQASIAASADGQALRMAAGTLSFGAIDLADADAVTGLLPFANITNLTGLSVLGRSGTTSGVLAAITGTASQVLVVNTAGTSLAFGQVQTGGIGDSQVTLAKLANAAASSVLGRSVDTGGVYADIVSSADGQVLRRGASGVLAWGAVDLADADAVTGLLPFANLASGSATSVFARASGTTGVMASLAATADGQFLQRVGGALTWATIGTSSLGGGTAVGQVLINAAGNVPTWGAVDLADSDAVTGLLPHANVASLAGLSVFGRSANTSGVMAAITGTDGLVLRVAGTALGFGTVATAGIADGNVTLAKLVNATASSVLGRSAATGGVYADIASSADGQVLRRGASGVLAWGAVDLADSDAVTGLLPFANIASGAATSVLGRNVGSTGVLASIAASADGQVLTRVGGALAFATIGVGTLAGGSAVGQVIINTAGNVPAWGALDLADADAVTGLLPLANMASLAALSVLGRATNTSGVMAAITGSADQVLAVNAGGTALAFGQVQTGGIATSAVTLAKLANATASSVLGRSAATTGAYADITSSADGQVLRRGASGVIGFGAVDLADTDAVTGLLPFANIASIATDTLLGRDTAGTGVLEQIGLNATLSMTGAGALQRAALTGDVTAAAGSNTTAIAAGVIVDADVNAAAAIAVTKLAGGSAVGQVLRNTSGNVPAWGAVDLADADAITNRLPLGNLTNGGAVGRVLVAGASDPAWSAVDLANSNAVTGLLPISKLSVGTNGRVLTMVVGVPDWNTALGNASDAFTINGNSVGISSGTTFNLGVSGGNMLSANDLGSGRRALGLFENVTTSQMPAGTGNGTLFWGEASGGVTTGFPSGGCVVWNDATFGLSYKGKNGVETTIAPHGEAGNTTKRRIIDWKSRPERATDTTGTQFTAASFDVSNFNNQGITNGILEVTARFFQAGSTYASVHRYTEKVTISAGVASAASVQVDHQVAGDMGALAVNIDVVSNTIVRLRLTQSSFGPPTTETWAFFEVSGFEF